MSRRKKAKTLKYIWYSSKRNQCSADFLQITFAFKNSNLSYFEKHELMSLLERELMSLLERDLNCNMFENFKNK